MSTTGRTTHTWPSKESVLNAAHTHKEVLLKGTLHRKEAWRSVQSALQEEAAPQVRAAIGRAARAGLPPTRQREAEARLRQRDAAAAERLSESASATPFRMALYQDALNIAARFKLLDVSASCASLMERRRHDVAQALTKGMHSAPASALQAHLDAAGELGLGREAEDCRAALSARQAAAASALQAAANQAEALTFSDALRCAADAGVEASLVQTATIVFESRLHAAAAMYVQALHHLPVAGEPAQIAAQAVQMTGNSDPESFGMQGGSSEEQKEDHLRPPDVAHMMLDGVASHDKHFLNISLERLSSFGPSLLSYTALTSLDARSNQVKSVAGLAQLVTLEHLHLGDNKLACVSSLASLSRLMHLDLSFNRLEAPGSVPPLSSLRQLSLEGNMLNSLAGCPPLCSLTWLSLASNSLSSLQGLQPLPALEVLLLGNNECTSLKGVQQCPQLTRLDAVQNRLPTVPDIPLRHLRHLSLASNRVTCVPELLCYQQLAMLELQNNHIGKIAEQRGLSALVSLNMSANLLQHASELQNLRLLVSLTELQLTCNAMEQQPGYVLARERTLPQLEWDNERQRVPAPVLEARLSSALAASTWAAVALQSWQCHGGRQPLRLPCASHICRAPRAQLLCRRHDSLANMHRALLKDHALESQEALWRQHCAATQVAAVWRGRQSRRQLKPLLAEHKQARESTAASAIQAVVRRWLQRRSGLNASPGQQLRHGRHSSPANNPPRQATGPSSDRATTAGHAGKPYVSPMDSCSGVYTLAAPSVEQVRLSMEDMLRPPENDAPCGSVSQSGSESAGHLHSLETRQPNMIEPMVDAVILSDGVETTAGTYEDVMLLGVHHLQDPYVPLSPCQQAAQTTLDTTQTNSHLQDPETPSGSEKDSRAQVQSRHELPGELDFHDLQLLLSSHEL